MARPREFNEQAVLEAATQRFWLNGYEATSVRDLADDMGLTSASLYNAFGDKRALYRRILDLRRGGAGELRQRVRRADSASARVEAIL